MTVIGRHFAGSDSFIPEVFSSGVTRLTLSDVWNTPELYDRLARRAMSDGMTLTADYKRLNR